MTPEQLALLRQRLTECRQPIDGRAFLYPFPRGWNAAFDFVEKTIKEVLGEKAA